MTLLIVGSPVGRSSRRGVRFSFRLQHHTVTDLRRTFSHKPLSAPHRLALKHFFQIPPESPAMPSTKAAVQSAPLSVSSPAFVPSEKFRQEFEQAAATASASGSNTRKRPAPPSPSLNPSMIPQQPKPITGHNSTKDDTRRLIVVLEQACLETYKHSSPATSSNSRNGKGGEDKYSLLNCDDHQGVLAKMGRDIAHARPDITHQVNS